MRVLVLGGSGGMGEVATREAATFPFVESVRIGDLNDGKGCDIASSIGPKASFCRLDVNDRSAMREELKACDVVLNAVGPFYVLGLPVLEQVISAGVNYADICDDWEPTQEMLGLSDAARGAGVTAIIGAGASPGVTNLLAVIASEQLDDVDEVITGWRVETHGEHTNALVSSHPKVAGASAAVVHWVQQLTGEIRVLKDGGFQSVNPLEHHQLPWPGEAKLDVWTVGHPEAVTLPLHIKGLTSCQNVMVGQASVFQELKKIAALVNQGVISHHDAADLIVSDALVQPEEELNVPIMFGWAQGTRNGTPHIAKAEIHSLPPGGMAGATSVPLALTLNTLNSPARLPKGVFAPEQIIDPRQYLDQLALKCVGDLQGADELVSVSVAQAY